MLPRIPEIHLEHTAEPDRPLRLLSVVRRRLRELRYSRRTEETYVHWIVRFIRFNDRRHPRDLGVEDVRRFLSSLAVQDQVSASTQNVALAAIRFLYERTLKISMPRIDGECRRVAAAVYRWSSLQPRSVQSFVICASPRVSARR